MLRLENVGLIRTDRDGKSVTILHGVSFEARPGEVTVIVGPSGGGKSSLVRLVNRLDEPTSGRVLLDGEEISAMDPLQLRRRVAMVPQKPFMFEGTVLANLQRPFLYRNEAPPGAGSGELLQAVELARLPSELLDREARTLSLGQQQRVSLARALITGPRALLLDEPTSALDRPTADRLAATLREICRGGSITVLMVTHDLRLAERTADYLLYLEGGRILEEGKPGEILKRPRTAELARFLAEPEE